MLFIAACATTGEEARQEGGATESPGQEDGEDQTTAAVKIGIVHPLTGPVSWLGEPAVNGMLLAVEEINDSGGINGAPIETVQYDDAGEGERAVSFVNRAIHQDDVDALVAGQIVPTAEAIRPVVAGKILTYTTGGGTIDPPLFVQYPGLPEVAREVLEFTANRNLERVGVIAGTDGAGQDWVDAIQQVKDDYPVDVTTERFHLDDVDISAQIARLHEKNIDILFAMVVGEPVGLVIRTVDQVGLDTPVVVPHANISDAFLNLIKGIEPAELFLPAPKYVVWEELPEEDPVRARAEEFVAAYEDKYGETPPVYAAVGYDSMRLVATTLEEAGLDDYDAQLNFLQDLQGYEGLMGEYNFSPEDNRGLTQDAMVMVQVVDGEFVSAAQD